MANETISFGDGSAYGYPMVEKELFQSRMNWTAAQAAATSNTAVHASVADTGVTQVITTGITNPPVARTIIAKPTGTAANVTAVSVTLTGTDIRDQVITETLPPFTATSLNGVTSLNAFKTVTSISQPAVGASTGVSYGVGNALGLYHYLNYNTVQSAALNGVKESTAPTVTTSLTNLGKNTILLNSALNGTAVQCLYTKHFDQTLVG